MEMKDNETIGLRTIFLDYLLHWKLFLAVFLISSIVGILYLIITPKTYEVYSSIQLQDENDMMASGGMGLGEASGLMKSFGLGALPSAGINLDDEVAILMSNELTNSMVLELGLNIEYYKPWAWKYKMYADSPLRVTADSTVFSRLQSTITLQVVVNNQKVKVTTKIGKEKLGTKTYDSLPVQIELKQGVFTLSATPSFKDEIRMKIVIRPSRWVAEELVNELSIDEYSKTSNIIELIYQDYEQERAVDLLKSLINQYNARAEKIKKEEKGGAYAFVNGRIESLITDLAAAEEEIERFKIKNNMTDPTYDLQLFVEQMRELQVKIIEVEAQVHVIDMMDAYVKDPANRFKVVPGLLSVKDGENVGALASYNEALMERSRLLNTTHEKHPTILALNGQIDKLREGVFLTISNARKGIQLTLNDLRGKEQYLYSRMGEVPTQERKFIELKRHQEILQGVYLILLQKREELALSLGQDRLKARVVDTPFIRMVPVGPRKLYAALGIMFFTIFIPVVYLFVRKQWSELKRDFKVRYADK